MDEPLSTPSPATEAPKNVRSSVWDIYFPKSGIGHPGAVYIASFPPIMYFWPTILVALFAAIVQGFSGTVSGNLGWFFVAVLALNFLVLVHDFDQKQFLIFLLAVVIFWMLVWIVDLYGFTFLRRMSNWILSFEPGLSTDAYFFIGGALLLLFLWGMVTPLFNYWLLDTNEFIHYTQPVGRDMSVARAGCSVYKEIPDIFECILSFGGGTLVIRRNEQVLATIPHIPFLGKRMAAIEHLLAETRVVVERSE